MHRTLRGLWKSLMYLWDYFCYLWLRQMLLQLQWWNWQQFCKHIKRIPLDGSWPPVTPSCYSVSPSRGLQGITAVKGLMALSVWLREFACRHTQCRLQWPRKYRWIAQQNHSHKVEQNAERAYCWEKTFDCRSIQVKNDKLAEFVPKG